jgi:predicted 3-demethylubiquinone-9 3-methyltransferase (glyoxalase superfamily)
MADLSILLMFEGRAEEAMNFYCSLLPGSEVTMVMRYEKGEPGPEGSVKQATFTLAGSPFRCIDSPVHHDFTFTPAVSVHLACATEAEVDSLFAGLSDGGMIMMPLMAYPFARKFTWVTDRFGVSWQLMWR